MIARTPKGQFIKGQSGNPVGARPKSLDLKKLLDECWSEDERKLVIVMLAEKALAGDLKAAEMLLDRCYGKPVQAIEHGGPDGDSIVINLETMQITQMSDDDLSKLIQQLSTQISASGAGAP